MESYTGTFARNFFMSCCMDRTIGRLSAHEFLIQMSASFKVDAKTEISSSYPC